METSIFYIYGFESDIETRLRFTRDFLRELEMFKRMYGDYPQIIIFKGKYGKILYDIVIKKNLNFGAVSEFIDYYDSEVIMKSDKEITIVEDKVHEFGISYVQEKKIKPEYSIKILKI